PFIHTPYQTLPFPPSTNRVIHTLQLSPTINTEYPKHGFNFLPKKYRLQLTQHHTPIYHTQPTPYIFIKILQQIKQLPLNNHLQINKK
ncbi:hypothetical protein, partial [Staphylococcus epidermidis]|uniref:hypothetical protein n=1 Tax=Staphylococcus epidermidis TaxID=1282 RepID=UPI0021B1D796